MEILLQRLILGAAFFLLFIISLLLITMKDGILQSPKMHRYMGGSGMLAALCMLYMRLELDAANEGVMMVLRVVIALLAICACGFWLWKFSSHLFNRLNHTDTHPEPTKEVAPTVPQTEEVKEPEQVVETEETGEQAEIAEEVEETPEEGGDIADEPSLDNLQDLIFFQKLEALMAQKKLFSEPELTRDEVAAEIGTNRTYLIRSIKMATGMTFNEYLNSLRVNYAATLLATTDEPLDDIGAIAGFRSKSAYYRSFTAANDCTPSEYRKRNKGN